MHSELNAAHASWKSRDSRSVYVHIYSIYDIWTDQNARVSAAAAAAASLCLYSDDEIALSPVFVALVVGL